MRYFVDSRSREEKLQQFWIYKHIVNLVPGLEAKVNACAVSQENQELFVKIVSKVRLSTNCCSV